MIVGQPGQLVYADALYLSITVLTSTGFEDVTPLTRPARAVCSDRAELPELCSSRYSSPAWLGSTPPRESYIDGKVAQAVSDERARL